MEIVVAGVVLGHLERSAISRKKIFIHKELALPWRAEIVLQITIKLYKARFIFQLHEKQAHRVLHYYHS